MKALEYLAHELTVVSTPIDGLSHLSSGIRVCSDPAGFVSEVQEALVQDHPTHQDQEISFLLKRNSWSRVAERLVKLADA